MNEFILIGIVILYFVMGFGVFNMWKELVDDEKGIFIALLWPLILLITALVKRD